jgi:hypothetical protein
MPLLCAFGAEGQDRVGHIVMEVFPGKFGMKTSQNCGAFARWPAAPKAGNLKWKKRGIRWIWD